LGPGGKVLVADGNNAPVVETELYDPPTGAWTIAGSLVTTRQFHTATLLPDGRVLVVGGFGAGGIPLSGAELGRGGRGP